MCQDDSGAGLNREASSADKDPTVLDEWETANFVKAGNSLARFGDGEINIAFNGKDAFQNYDESLAVRLREVLDSRHPGLGIGVPDIFSSHAKQRLSNPAFWIPYELQLRNLLCRDQVYYSNFFSRPDNCCVEPGEPAPNRNSPAHVNPTYWELLQSIWEDRHLLLINFNPLL